MYANEPAATQFDAEIEFEFPIEAKAFYEVFVWTGKQLAKATRKKPVRKQAKKPAK